MTIDERHFNKLSNRSFSLFLVAELFGLTEEEIDHPSCGAWIVDNIKQLQTSQLMIKTMSMRSNENQKIENYSEDPFKNKPLLETDSNNRPV